VIILAVDPGPEESAWVLYNTEKQEILGKAKEDNDSVLLRLTYPEVSIDYLVIEMIASYGMAVGESVFETCVWIGRFMQKWKQSQPGKVERIKRKQIVMEVCGSPRAKDSNVRQAMIDKFGPPGTKKNPGKTHGFSKDLWAALAVAVGWWDRKARTK